MTKIKICGITNKKDAEAAVHNGADALGFIFYKESPRCVTVEIASKISREMPPFVKKVGVFVNENSNIVNRIASTAGLDLLQFNGDEQPDYFKNLNRPYIKAFRIKDRKSLDEIDKFDVPYVLLDSYGKNEYGGTGKSFDWNLIRNQIYKNKYVILSGGLNPENVGSAIEQINPYAVDVASGVEGSPGKKDHVKMKNFIEAVRR